MNNDLISKAELFNKLAVIKAPPEANEYKGEVYSIIQAMETADDGWIPCNEKMPEDGQAVIICTDDKRFKGHPVGTCIYEDGRFHTNYHDDISMIAWMPLPEPYKGGGKEWTEEMELFRKMLDDNGIEWHDASDMDAYPITRTHFNYRGHDWSVIHGYGSYGGYNRFEKDKGLLELMSGAVNDGDPVGYLTAKEAFDYVKGEAE